MNNGEKTGYMDASWEVEEFGLVYGESDAFEDSLPEGEEAGSFTVCSASDALVLSKNRFGRINLPYMEKISGLSTYELISRLAGKAMWQDPEAYASHQNEEEDWLLGEQYFSGNLFKKLQEAIRQNKKYGRFSCNIEALKKRLPEALSMDEIHVNLGSPWIPAHIYRRFIKKLLAMPGEPEVTWNEFLGRWRVRAEKAENLVGNRYTYGTSRMSALQIIEHAMNAAPVKVTDPVLSPDGGSVEYVVNKEETLAAQEKERMIQEEFCGWVRSVKDVQERLEELYCEKYGYVGASYEGDFLSFADMNPEVKLYSYQKNAIARIVLTKNVLLAHTVGSGKTYEIVAGCHERKRMGISEKNLVVTPNNVLDATVRAHKYLYPQDSVLAIYSGDFTPGKRGEVIRKIREENYTAIYMAYSSFDKLTMSKRFYLARKRREIRRCRAAIDTARGPWEEKPLKTAHEKLCRQLVEISEKEFPEDTACFDLLGVTTLVVDECHNYKNISIDLRMENLVGMHTKGSKKCDEMLEKVHYVQDQGGGVIFATGTPLTNSMMDLYVLQTYLQPEELEMCQVARFGQWMNTFAEKDKSFEIDVDSQNFRIMSRFVRFHNLPELMGMFSTVCDFYYSDEKNQEIPQFDGHTDILVKKSEEQETYIRNLVKRTEDIRARRVRMKEDNLLKVTTDGRKCALDIRLVEPKTRIYDDRTKTAVCAKQIADIYYRYPGTAQIAFCDSSTPKQSFNIYDELRLELVLLGLPEEEIAFIHEATTEGRRRTLLEKLNKGKIRVMVGSTPKLGIGVNVQEKLIAIHHLDIPWKPSDMVQREGRLFRQGNQNEKGFVFRYVTEGSFDAYTWQILENKQKFISSFLSGSMSRAHREERDLADSVLNYAEIKALAIGNPLIRRRVETANTLEQLRIWQRQRKMQISRLQAIVNEAPAGIARCDDMIDTLEADIAFYQQSKNSMSMEEREAFGEELLQALSANIMQPKERIFDWYQEFEVVLPAGMTAETPHVYLRRPGGGSYYISMKGDKSMGCSRRLDYALEHLPDRKKEQEEERRAIKRRRREAGKVIEQGNPYDEQIEHTRKLLEEIDRELNAE